MRKWPKVVWRVTVLVLVNLIAAGILLNLSGNVPALSKLGSRSDEVTQIRTKLKERGLYAGNIDGIFGTQTQAAVIQFQKQKGLTPDGIAGPATLQALGIGSSQGGGSVTGFSDADLDLLARVVSAESRGEPYEGQVAVAAVILNRIEHPSFPNTLSGVIYQPGAFSCLTDGGINAPVADSAYRASRDAINGWDPSGGAIYYYNPKKSTSQWIFSRPIITVIGDFVLLFFNSFVLV